MEIRSFFLFGDHYAARKGTTFISALSDVFHKQETALNSPQVKTWSQVENNP
jgi:hypothetical protein